MSKNPETLGAFLRTRRLELEGEARPEYSLTQLAKRIGKTPSYVSQIELDQARSAPSEETLTLWAQDLGLDRDVVLAMAGKVASDISEIIRRRPQLFGSLVRELRNTPDKAVLRLVREVRDGEW